MDEGAYIVEPEPMQERTVEVVGYDVVRSTVEGVASDAAQGAADAVASRVEDAAAKVTEGVEDAAQSAADRAISGYLASSGQEDAEADSGAENALYTVQLAPDQWQWVQDSMRVQSACSLLSFLVLCALLGARLAGFFVKGWRR